MNQLTDCASQLRAVADFFDVLGAQMDRLPEPIVLPQSGSPAQHMEAEQ
jgi:hypothetical protein